MEVYEINVIFMPAHISFLQPGDQGVISLSSLFMASVGNAVLTVASRP